MSYYLAIDAGGTSTRCLLADSDTILARATTGSVKLMRVPESEATARLHAMLDEVSITAGVPLSQITRTCIGLAGLSIPAVHAWATLTLAAHVAGEVILCGDEEIALAAAFPSASGILVIAGTGSNVIGRASDGSLHSAGGWGPILGDEGSGFWIGLEAIRAALRAHDRSHQPHDDIDHPDNSARLLAEIQRAFNLNSLPELIALGNHRGDANRAAPDFASLAPVVAHCAEHGNPIAVAILNRAGEQLAAQVALVARKISAHTEEVSHRDRVPHSSQSHRDEWDSAETISVAFTGSVLTHIDLVRTAMISSLAQTLPTSHIHPTAIDPLEGALYRARHA
ncbi:MAG: hypothetical protein M3O31_18000 [Acidobacteriota bacterium]|nr:hypothetical protein [Acidobacteriota bacterium]